MNPIFGAIAAGYTTKEIINFISNMFPGFSGKISQAISSGYSPDEVIKYLQKLNKSDFGKVAKKGNKNINYKLPEDDDKPKTSMEKANEIWYGGKEEFVPEQPKKSSVLPNLGKVALGATALGAGALASPMARTALSRALPSLSPLLQGAQAASQMPQAPTGQEEQISPDSLQSQQPPINNQVASNIPQPQPVAQPEGIPTNIQNPLDKTREEADALWQRIQKGVTKHPDKDVSSFLKVASDLQKYQGLKREDFDKLYQQFMEKKNSGVPTAEIAKDMFSTYKQEQPEPIIEKDLTEEKPTIEKGSSVSSPQGVGVLKELRNGQALIDIDGKLHKVKEEDLEPPMFSDDEVADAYDNLMAKIPEEHKSGFISWAGYDEDRNVLGFIPRGGKYEELKDITPEEANIIKEGKGVARTNGETREGLWVMGEDTRGGLISQIIHDRRKANKASEEKQLKLGFEIPKPEKEDKGMKPLFDEMAHAREKSRERERKKKEEEKARKKKEKDEAKKRKK